MKKVFFLLFLLMSAIVQAQSFSAGPDQAICSGESCTLQGTGPSSYTYLWTSVPNDPTISDPTSLTPEVQPLQTTVYTLEGRSVSIVNSVTNGHFENGNTGFTSAYTYSPGPNGLWNEGTYAITNDASYNHNNFTCNQDHTSGSGNFMAVNGAGAAGVVVWSTNISVDPNTEYEFKTWVMSLSPTSPAILQFRINNVLLGEPFVATSTTCQWNQFFEEWNSGSATTAEISIVNQNTATNGNDFALDDIGFAKVTYYYDNCQVNVNPVPTSDFELPAQSCSSDTVITFFTGNASADATYYWSFSGATIVSGTGPGPYQLIWADEGLKAVSLYVDDVCISTTTTQYINILQSPLINVSASPSTINYGATTTLHGSMTGNSGELVFEWNPEDSIQNPNHLHPQTKPLRRTTLFTFTSNNLTNGCSASDTVTVFVTGGPLGILSFTASPDTICYGESSVLSVTLDGGSGIYTNTWTSNPPGFNHSGDETLLTVTPQITTTYYVTSSDGVTTTETDSVIVVVLPLTEIISQPDDTVILSNGIAVFSVEANNETGYQWQVSTDGGSTWTDLSENPPYTGTRTGTLTVSNATTNLSGYLYRCVVGSDCDPVTSDDALLTVADSPDIVGNLDDIITCQLDTINVTCSLSSFIDIDSFNLVFLYDTALLSYLKTEPLPQELSNVQANVIEDSIILNWNNNVGITIPDGHFFNFLFIAKNGGEAFINFNDASAIRNSFGFNPFVDITSSLISITPLPVDPDSAIVFPDSVNILDEIDIDLEIIGGDGSYVVWTIDSCGGDSIGSGQTLSLIRPEQTTTYYAMWKNICGSSVCKSTIIKIIENYAFSVPNAFTPNGDGKNDVFGIISPSKLPVFNFYVFNRWGQLVFETDNQNELWDGTLNGAPCNSGTYVWKAKYQYRIEGTGSELHEESGTVTLIR